MVLNSAWCKCEPSTEALCWSVPVDRSSRGLPSVIEMALCCLKESGVVLRSRPVAGVELMYSRLATTDFEIANGLTGAAITDLLASAKMVTTSLACRDSAPLLF